MDVAAPNLTAFPLFATLTPLVVILPPGSALFLPAGWWHAVVSLDTSISVALRMQTRCQSLSAAPDDVLRFLHGAGLYRKGNCVCHAGGGGGGAAVADDDSGNGGNTDVDPVEAEFEAALTTAARESVDERSP